MCFTVPGKVAGFQGGLAVVEWGGVKRTVKTLETPRLKKGDYVLVRGGYAVEKLTAAQARRMLEAWRML